MDEYRTIAPHPTPWRAAVYHVIFGTDTWPGKLFDIALLVAITLAAFAILFGTRKIDVTEHHEGMMVAIAFESIVKLLAFVAVGLFALFMLGAAADGMPVSSPREAVFRLDRMPDAFVTQLILASAAIFCLPRQFHVAIVEAHKDANIQMARWTFPLYLLVFTVFIVPIALAGMMAVNTVQGEAERLVLNAVEGAGFIGIAVALTFAYHDAYARIYRNVTADGAITLDAGFFTEALESRRSDLRGAIFAQYKMSTFSRDGTSTEFLGLNDFFDLPRADFACTLAEAD